MTIGGQLTFIQSGLGYRATLGHPPRQVISSCPWLYWHHILASITSSNLGLYVAIVHLLIMYLLHMVLQACGSYYSKTWPWLSLFWVTPNPHIPCPFPLLPVTCNIGGPHGCWIVCCLLRKHQRQSLHRNLHWILFILRISRALISLLSYHLHYIHSILETEISLFHHHQQNIC